MRYDIYIIDKKDYTIKQGTIDKIVCKHTILSIC